MRWTQQQLDEYEAKRKAYGATSCTKPEQAVQHEPMAKKEGERKDTSRIQLRIISFRRRLIDPDNLCPKYFIDCLRYSGIIKDDREEDVSLEIRQIKVKSKSEEGTEIEVIYEKRTAQNP